MTINGVRGYYLLCWGIGYLGVGTSYLINPSPKRAEAFSWLPFWPDPDKWGWVFLACGIVAIVTAFRTVGNSTNRSDRWGFTALFIAPLIWTVIYGVASFIIQVASPLSTVLIFGPIACGHLAASRMVNAPMRDQPVGISETEPGQED